MFDDHFVVESPGILPGLVRVNNIREFHFSRNPKIVELLGEYDLVKEFGEGVDRVFTDMEDAGLPDPVYRQTGFMLYAELRNKNWGKEDTTWNRQTEGQAKGQAKGQAGGQADIEANQIRLIEYCKSPRTRAEMMDFLGMKNRTTFADNYMEPLLKAGKLFMTIPDKPSSPKQKYYSKA